MQILKKGCDSMVCPKCGTQYDDNLNRCPQCGAVSHIPTPPRFGFSKTKPQQDESADANGSSVQPIEEVQTVQEATIAESPNADSSEGVVSNPTETAATVSYTHLDVYKRQGYHFPKCPRRCNKPLSLPKMHAFIPTAESILNAFLAH